MRWGGFLHINLLSRSIASINPNDPSNYRILVGPFWRTICNHLPTSSSFSDIVPVTFIFDGFEKFSPITATVSSSLLLGIYVAFRNPNTIFRSAVENAFSDSERCGQEDPSVRMSCFYNKVLSFSLYPWIEFSKDIS
ncbi:uncharacterized protein LOC122082192 [Macadamia integrifolia]|uniref:uncharacterized protein LOC122082192 n=1 Tax=Macadamia integrifolia TaxID=60698 RepID=UPI001C4EEAEA|nr:uncharacterized protein LOC122082192 [Macadamia integrifolia]